MACSLTVVCQESSRNMVCIIHACVFSTFLLKVAVITSPVQRISTPIELNVIDIIDVD